MYKSLILMTLILLPILVRADAIDDAFGAQKTSGATRKSVDSVVNFKSDEVQSKVFSKAIEVENERIERNRQDRQVYNKVLMEKVSFKTTDYAGKPAFKVYCDNSYLGEIYFKDGYWSATSWASDGYGNFETQEMVVQKMGKDNYSCTHP